MSSKHPEPKDFREQLDASNAVVKNSILTLKITQLGSLGEGIAEHEGQTVFVPKTAPGDEVVVRVLQEKKGRKFAEALEWKAKATEHQEVFCSHFYSCGGCQLQQQTYEQQITWKKNIIQHWIDRSPLAPFQNDWSLEFVASPQIRNYRHRVKISAKDSHLYFYEAGSHQPVYLKECPVLVEGFFEALQEEAKKRDFSMESFSFSQSELRNNDDEAFYELEGKKLGYSGGCFTQGNLWTNEQIIKSIIEQCETMESRKLALDYYCGIGNISLQLEPLFERVIGVESSPESIRWAERNSRKIEWRQASTESATQLLDQKPDLVVLDPPRTGALHLCRKLVEKEVPKVIYLSCSLSSLIRDLTPLLKKKKYRISRWLAFDLFPQTRHMECLVTLDRIS